MGSHLFILAIVMTIAGVFGGTINYFLITQEDDDSVHWWRCIVIAVGAAFLVPVALYLIQSELILEIQGDPSRLLIYTGYCLIAAVASRFVLSSQNDRILFEATEAKRKVESLQHDIRLIQEELIPLIETETEQDFFNDDNSGPLETEEELDVTSSKVLKTLGCGRYIFRSMAGLCREASTDETTMTKTLNVLVAKNLAGHLSSKKGVRWYLTDKGRRVMDVMA